MVDTLAEQMKDAVLDWRDEFRAIVDGVPAERLPDRPASR